MFVNNLPISKQFKADWTAHQYNIKFKLHVWCQQYLWHVIQLCSAAKSGACSSSSNSKGRTSMIKSLLIKAVIGVAHLFQPIRSSRILPKNICATWHNHTAAKVLYRIDKTLYLKKQQAQNWVHFVTRFGCY